MDRVRDWRMRLNHSLDLGTGFAAPGESLHERYTNGRLPLKEKFSLFLKGRRVVELGAGMMSYGYELAVPARRKTLSQSNRFTVIFKLNPILALYQKLIKQRGFLTKLWDKICLLICRVNLMICFV